MQYSKPAEDLKPVKSFPVAIITSQFNEDVTQALKEGAIDQLRKRGIEEKDILLFDVPGAIEIPLVAQRIASKKMAKAIITLGSVIRGDTSHYDLVCDVVSDGCMRVSLDHSIPVLFGVLTTENHEQAWDRLGGKFGHKGREVADCAVAMHELLVTLG
ncbi:riboflavin synthase beta chain (6,7-dimethyl-8-ribityllumazine synthase) [Legionella birminghamensis]|uniref:6,7-dimethyl-8-ribityllumazine synthase n=1 Tax=Legionella birminghamensis TaxID=28083 RepID=A0A378I9W3_9GAMM|nr:6,7-dimethyl-8-ribityllumazine synthase [Legionella birminghamensis]KTC69363.1 riboflavin synthase beta chain (6,7-dimethyl-8-ribityllumazine synthase) [Legionella birminghamensis]STX31626.1 riboflavin synthase subunit beta [Legionella birminghamensis]